MVYLPKTSVKDLDVGKLIPSFLVALATCLLANNVVYKSPYGSTNHQLEPLRASCTVMLTKNFTQLLLSVHRTSTSHSLCPSQIFSCYYALVGVQLIPTNFLPYFESHRTHFRIMSAGPSTSTHSLSNNNGDPSEILPRTCNLSPFTFGPGFSYPHPLLHYWLSSVFTPWQDKEGTASAVMPGEIVDQIPRSHSETTESG